jgi:hypothetical protein
MNKNTIQPTKKLLQHMCWWVDHHWCYPRAASLDLKSFQWDTEICRVIFTESNLTEGKLRPWESDTTDERPEPNDMLERSRKLINSVIERVETDAYWRSTDPLHKKMVRKI